MTPTESAAQTPDRTTVLGLARLARLAFAGADLNPLWAELAARAEADPADAAALLDLSTILLLTGRRERGLAMQAAALARSPVYRRPHGRGTGPRMLALMVSGDLMANTPVDFLLEGSDVDLTLLYLDAPSLAQTAIPDHDVALLAVGESQAAAPLLAGLAPVIAGWPRPTMNGAPERIAALTRDGVCALFRGDPHVLAPETVRVARAELAAVATGGRGLEALLPGAGFPIIARPLGSHAGTGLEKLDGTAALARYLSERAEAEFYLAPFVDYRGSDGLYRKQRIALVDGRPFVSHMAVSGHWMVHYLNAGMGEDAGKRAEEAAFMAGFDADFAVRHRAAFDSLHRRIGLDYFAVDCAEAPDGRLLLFEADTAMIVHAMDPPDLYPYKQPAMAELFAAFVAALTGRAELGKADVRELAA